MQARPSPGKRTLTGGLPVQARAADIGGQTSSVQERAADGVSGSPRTLPFLPEIQPLFGHHDVTGVEAHVGGEAAAAAADIGAQAYATGNQVAFAGSPDLHTAAHEAAHVVQQRGGVQLKDGVGRSGDPYERHADAVADRVVAGRSAEGLLDEMAGGSGGHAVQMREENDRGAPDPGAPDPGAPDLGALSGGGVDHPQAAINLPGFVDHSDGANIRTGPAEQGGTTLTGQPLAPATRVFVSGRHPGAADWWYVTAFLPGGLLRGYVQHFRITTDLPEPTARLYQIQSGDTAEGLARREFSSAVRPGHDLRFYENVLLAVNRARGRTGITGSFQDPNILGGGANNIQLVAGQRIWLVSAAYASALEGEVPDGSLTNGAVARVRQAMGHLQDILKSVTDSPQYFGAVAGEYADAIRQHLPEIIGITAAFILAEAASAFLAATPTGVGQLAAVLIQLALAAFGAHAAVEAGTAALEHGGRWLTLAWTAGGDPSMLRQASEEFLRMLVSVAMAALALLGAGSNMSRGLRVSQAIHITPPTVGWPAMATADGAVVAGGPVIVPGAITSSGPVSIGPSLMSGVGPAGRRVTGGAREAAEPRPRASEIPSVRDGEFARWFNQLTPDEFEALWANPETRRIIEARLRHPGGMHEWHLVSRANVFKRWGVTAEQIAELRTAISEMRFVNPTGRHGGFGSTAAHNELLGIIDSSASYADFVRRLQNWANYRLEGGVDALPPGLRP